MDCDGTVSAEDCDDLDAEFTVLAEGGDGWCWSQTGKQHN